MAKTLRVLTDPDFTTKGSVLTKEEADQDLIDIWNEFTSGSGTVNAGTLQVAGTNLFPDGDPQDLGIGDDVTFNQLILTTRWRNQSTDKWEAGFNRITQSSTYRGLQIGNTNNRDWHVGSTSTDSSTDRHDLIFAGGSSGASDVILGVTRTSDGGANWIPEFRMFGDGTTQWAKAATFDAGLSATGGNIVLTGGDYRLFEDDGGNVAADIAADNTGGLYRARSGGSVTIQLDGRSGNTSYFNSGGGVAIAQTTLTSGSVLTVGGASDFTGNMKVSRNITIADANATSVASLTVKQNDGSTTDTLIRGDGGVSFIALQGSLGIATSSVTSGSVLTVGGDADVQGDLEVTGRLDAGNIFADEFVINHTSVIGGNLIISPARGKIDSINTGASTVTISDPNATGGTQFQANDIFVVEAIDVNGATIVSADGTVTSVSGTTLTLSFSTGLIGDLSVGDVIVQRGSTSDTARQALIETAATATGAPYMRFYRNLDAVADFGNTANVAVQIGTAQDVTGFSEPGIFGFKTDGTVGFGFTQGKFAYDGIKEIIHVKTKTSGFNDGDSILDSISSQNYTETATANAGASTTDDEHRFGLGPYEKVFGIDTIRMIGFSGVSITGSPNTTHSVRVYVEVQDWRTSTTVVEDFAEWTSTGNQQFSFDTDISSLTDGNYYEIFVRLYAKVDATAEGSGGPYDTTGSVAEDFLLVGMA